VTGYAHEFTVAFCERIVTDRRLKVRQRLVGRACRRTRAAHSYARAAKPAFTMKTESSTALGIVRFAQLDGGRPSTTI
jgi:hypothetical protein